MLATLYDCDVGILTLVADLFGELTHLELHCSNHQDSNERLVDARSVHTYDDHQRIMSPHRRPLLTKLQHLQLQNMPRSWSAQADLIADALRNIPPFDTCKRTDERLRKIAVDSGCSALTAVIARAKITSYG